MRKRIFPGNLNLLLLLAALAFGCGQDPTEQGSSASEGAAGLPAAAATPANSEDGPSDAVKYADEAALEQDPEFEDMRMQGFLRLLRGAWRSTSNSGMSLEFDGESFQRTQQGRVVRQGTIRFDMACEETACAAGKGWCFLENTAKGSVCYWVRRIDQKNLIIRDLQGEFDEVYVR